MPWSLLLNPTVLLGIALAGASLFGYVQTTRLGAAQDRIEAVKGEYAVRDRAAQEAAGKALQAAMERVRQAERQSVETAAAISAKYRKEVQDVAAHKDRIIGDLHTGVLSLRVQLATSANSGSGDAAGKAGSSAGQCNAAPTSGLLGPGDSAFLIDLASEADSVVVQLQSCQALVKADRAQ